MRIFAGHVPYAGIVRVFDLLNSSFIEQLGLDHVSFQQLEYLRMRQGCQSFKTVLRNLFNAFRSQHPPISSKNNFLYSIGVGKEFSLIFDGCLIRGVSVENFNGDRAPAFVSYKPDCYLLITFFPSPTRTRPSRTKLPLSVLFVKRSDG